MLRSLEQSFIRALHDMLATTAARIIHRESVPLSLVAADLQRQNLADYQPSY